MDQRSDAHNVPCGLLHTSPWVTSYDDAICRSTSMLMTVHTTFTYSDDSDEDHVVQSIVACPTDTKKWMSLK